MNILVICHSVKVKIKINETIIIINVYLNTNYLNVLFIII